MVVVLGYDESPGADAALATAVSVARRFGEELVIAYGAAPPGGLGEEVASHRAALMDMGRSATARAVETASDAGVPARAVLLDAKPADALVRVAADVDASVIVVGTNGESPFRGALLGSVPHRLLHIADRPVLCVPAG